MNNKKSYKIDIENKIYKSTNLIILESGNHLGWVECWILGRSSGLYKPKLDDQDSGINFSPNKLDKVGSIRVTSPVQPWARIFFYQRRKISTSALLTNQKN